MSVNALNGYAPIRCDWVADPKYLGLSMGAGGALLFLRLMADLSKFDARVRGAIVGQSGELWNVQDAILAVAEREVESQGHLEDEALELAGRWLYDLRDAGMVAFGSDQAILVVSAYNRDCSFNRRDKSRFLARVEGSASEMRADGSAGYGGPVACAGGTWDEAAMGDGLRPRRHVMSSRSAAAPAAGSAPPPSMGAEDGNGSPSVMALSVGGKGGVYPEFPVSKQRTNHQSHQIKEHSSKPSNHQSAREDAMGEGGGAEPAAGEFHRRIWDADLVSACEFACRQRDLIFRRTVLARARTYGEQVVREAAEYVADQFRDGGSGIEFTDPRTGQKIGGPILWKRIKDIHEARQACRRIGQKVGF